MSGRDQFDVLEMGPVFPNQGMLVGELMALADDGAVAIVHASSQPGCVFVRAGTVVDLHADHIGKQVVLAFAAGYGEKPIVLGVLRGGNRSAGAHRAGSMNIAADGERLVVDAKEQLVLRCGKACITLTKAGKVLIEGTYVLSRSTGAHRIQGGSVQLN